ncbi:MAG: aminotransferase class III-fold pyridoxal phosphate-dependent enzyme [Thermomicrobia bacterium]|nr:aminotransferase class III-fold pyridoxal phosphate-dependent enzyme [Thermomicrobia bacterium]
MVATWETTALIEQDIAHMLHPVTNLHRHAQEGPLILTEGKGSTLWDSEGKEYIDGFAGLWNVNVGHGRAELAEAGREQLARLAFQPTFFGMGTLAATGIPGYWQHFGPRAPGFLHVSAPYMYRNGEGMSEAEFVQSLVKELEETIEREGAETIAAFIGEPVQGAGGVIPPPDAYWPAIAAVLKKHDILFIADEVINGFGRTGTMFGTQQYGVQPDIVAMAKGITSGYIPLGAVGVTDAIYERMIGPDQTFMHGFTYSGHPVACFVALRNIAIIEDEDLPAQAAARGRQLLGGLRELHQHPHVGDVRGKGMMAIVELVADKGTKARFDAASDVGNKVQAATRKRGLIVRCSDTGIAISPPLVLTADETDRLIGIVGDAITEVFG